MARTSS